MANLRERLEQYGLGQHAELFAANNIDIDVLGDLTDADLEKLGVMLGDRRRILKAVARLADPATTAGGGSREAERRQLTVMFADLVDSTKLAARLDPEDMKDVIGRYQKAVGDEVTRFGGYVAKPLGDGLLIYFGWPQAHEDDAERAVRSGIAAIAAVRRLTTPEGAALAARIGIATGEVVVGDFAGAGVDEDGAVVGATPNLAARLQSVASKNAIVVADRTLRLLGGQFALTDLGNQTLKGFDGPIHVWQVDRELPAATRFAAHHGGDLGEFIGRGHELGMLRERWEQACEGECQLVLIAGEAGIGKSRLVSEFLGRVEGEPGRVSYQGSPLHMNTALYPVAHGLRSKAGFASDDSVAEKWNKLAAAIPSRSPKKRLALQFLADLISLETPPGETSGAASSAEEQREAALDVLADALKDEAQTAPLLIVVEDAHWLDATTKEFIERLLDRLQHQPAMVLVTYRPEFKPPWAQHANVGLLSLSRLGRRDARAIVESLSVGGVSLPQEIAEDIIAKGDGNPLFVRELTGSVLEAARSGGEGRFQIPATLRDSLSERLDRLGSAKEVAQIAAAFGRDFGLDLVAATLDRTEADLQSDLSQLLAIDVVFQASRSERRYTFRHALLQEAAYESMLKTRRREVHARIVEVLGEKRPEMAETEPEVLASHLARAGELKMAAECWQAAGRLASRNSAYREAIGAFTEALALMTDASKERADTHRAIAAALFATGDYRSVKEHLERAANDAEAAGDQVMMAEIAMQQSHDLIQYGGKLAEAKLYGERALSIAERLEDEPLAFGARFSLGHAAWITGNFAESIRVLTANLPENLRNPERVRDFGTAGSLMVDSLSILGACHAYRGEFDQAFGYHERAVALVTTGAFDFSVAQYHLNRSHLQRGDAATALPLLMIVVRHDTEKGLKFTLAWQRGLLGYCQALLGELEEGKGNLERAIEDADTLGLPQVRIFASGFLADALVERDPKRALELADGGLSLSRSGGYHGQEAELLRIRGAALAGMDSSQAEACVQESMALAQARGMRPEEGHARRVLGDIRSRAGRSDALEHYEAARAIYRELGMKYWLNRIG
jgi:class 3 adenylate cyclase/tetratricopeptide (TPR) repeat protein